MDTIFKTEAGTPVFSYDFKTTNEHYIVYYDCKLLKNIYALKNVYNDNGFVEKVKQILIAKNCILSKIFISKKDKGLFWFCIDDEKMYYCSEEFLGY